MILTQSNIHGPVNVILVKAGVQYHRHVMSRMERVKRNWEGECDQIQTNRRSRAQRRYNNEVMVPFRSTANPPTEAGRSTLDREERQKERTGAEIQTRLPTRDR